MAALIATIIVYLLGWISEAILNWLSGVYTTMFYLAFAIEISFRDIATNFRIVYTIEGNCRFKVFLWLYMKLKVLKKRKVKNGFFGLY